MDASIFFVFECHVHDVIYIFQRSFTAFSFLLLPLFFHGLKAGRVASKYEFSKVANMENM